MDPEELNDDTASTASAQKVSVSMPADRIAAVRARVGKRGFSAYVSAAVERQLQRDLLEELLQEKEAAIGPPSPEIEAWAEDVFRNAEAKAVQERGTTADGGGECHGREAA
ncbi:MULTISPECIES: CopG family transcriptional regulator [unclassified Streptomyces]|uniref:CopG family transcriptional regulator n=1 Tax=unclassified Streptomyces TaxID=2593676 RepID=UPI00340B1187